MALHLEPETSPVTTTGVVVDPEPPERPEFYDDLEEYTSPPVSPGRVLVPTTYEALSVKEFLDFRSHFDAGDLADAVPSSVRVPRDMHTMVDRVVQREDTPWSTRSEFYREGAWTLLKAVVDTLRVHDVMLLSLMAESKTRAATKFAVDRHRAQREMRENLEIQLLYWLDLGEPRECGRMITDYWDEARKIVHDSWRNHVCTVLRDHPLVKASAHAATACGFVFPSELRKYAGDWK